MGGVVQFLRRQHRGQGRQNHGQWVHGTPGRSVAGRQGVHVVSHGLLSHFCHVPECLREGAGGKSSEELVAFTTSLSATVPSFGADFFGVLAEERIRPLWWQVGVVDVERWRAERVEHLEDACIHPGRSAGIRVLWAG